MQKSRVESFLQMLENTKMRWREILFQRRDITFNLCELVRLLGNVISRLSLNNLSWYDVRYMMIIIWHHHDKQEYHILLLLSIDGSCTISLPRFLVDSTQHTCWRLSARQCKKLNKISTKKLKLIFSGWLCEEILIIENVNVNDKKM